MIRATTPTHVFGLPFEYEGYVRKVLITYSQGGEIVLEKNENDILVDGDSITVKLSQAETLSFDPTKDCAVQLRIITEGGDALASRICHIKVDNVLNDEVIQ